MTFTSQLLRFLRRAGTERSTGRVLAEVFQFVGEAFAVDRVSLHLVSRDTGRLEPFVSQFTSGEADPALFERWRRFDIESTDLVRRVREGEDAVLVDDPCAAGGVPRDFVETFDVGPFLAVALRRGDTLEGLLIIEGSPEALRRRRDEAVEFAEYLALALDNARAFEREQERTAEAQALLEIADVLARSTDPVSVLAAVAQQCARLTGFDRCSVFLVDPETNSLVPAMSQFADGHTDPAAWERFRSTESDLPIAWEVIRSGEPATFDRPGEHPDLIPPEWLEPFGIETVVYVPLTAWGQRFGVLELDHRERVPVTDRQVRMAVAVAAQGAVAIGVTRALKRERAAADELERASRVKDDFLSMVSHELRSPLTSIRGFADLLEAKGDQLDPEARREMAHRITVNADRQIALIDELLDSERLARGSLIVDRQHVDLDACVDEAIESVELADVTVHNDVDDRHQVLVDPGHLRQILVNLLTNAERYGRSPIEISSEDQGTSGTVALRIRDHGEGVPDGFVPHLFERFTQARPDGSKGVGLGLAIARQMARANEGDLVYEDGRPGACFVLTLPRFGRGGTT